LVRLFKLPHRSLDIKLALKQRFRIPFTPLLVKEISTINVDRPGQPPNWIGYGMDDVVPERFRRQKMLSSRPV
jgi:hypothetical protein